jgi:phage terminase large subunit
MTSNPFEKFVELYAKNPVGFVREVLGADPLPYQCELMEAVVAGERKISVRSGHGTGKSSCASWVMLHYLLFNYPCKVVVTAPTSGQLFDASVCGVAALDFGVAARLGATIEC